jgi:hypothetical protein
MTKGRQADFGIASCSVSLLTHKSAGALGCIVEIALNQAPDP